MNGREERARERQPQAIPPPRMAPLATLPVFFRLAGRRTIVIGGSPAAAWKAELLSATGARVEVWAPEPCTEMEALTAAPPGGPVALQGQAWHPGVLEGAALVIADAESREDAARIHRAATAAGIPLNVIDKPEFCTFQLGAIVNRSPLVVGISTDGAAPVFGQAIRARIEALLPAGFARWAAAAQAWRAEIAARRFGPAARRRFWDGFAALALASPGRAPAESDRRELLRRAHAPGVAEGMGHVALVGAGPGDPELLTLKALRLLRSADVILFDDLVAPEVLDYARREARRMLVGKTGHGPSCRQEDIIALMLSLARSGKRVVRLKSGDPMIFGRAGEEMAALDAAGIPCEVVPGISGAQGAAASLKVSLTERGCAQRLQFVTAHAKDGALPGDLDLAALADPKATTAIYMPLGNLAELTRKLLGAGASPDLPACAVFCATRPDELAVGGTLTTIGERVAEADAQGPCLVLIGSVLSQRAARIKVWVADTCAATPAGSAPRPRR
jgi:uroporphyrin-III C-methyltransferase/precorrin-2 dehydrogenase/sirohydrochlorin ferrochelatase